MQLVRQGLDIVGNVTRLFPQFLQTVLNISRIVLQLFEFDCQHCQSLVDVVVKLSPDPGTFLLLRLNQLSAQT